MDDFETGGNSIPEVTRPERIRALWDEINTLAAQVIQDYVPGMEISFGAQRINGGGPVRWAVTEWPVVTADGVPTVYPATRSERGTTWYMDEHDTVWSLRPDGRAHQEPTGARDYLKDMERAGVLARTVLWTQGRPLDAPDV
ncbi:MAG TPA: hypothetical protein VLF59_01490 [Candidatus Saccharimonadales bacterium]|nr:hypothetical protein [Candidatus Saccharimonadales bacterium]